ncbi:MAG: hypothetical protein JWP27_2511 [Flaviaesturariibacter sp.]|nr:hypothetical protein [Flaviaesturariibacter sp.]
MKKIIGITVLSLFLATASFAQAKEVNHAGKAVKTGAKKAGNKTAELASKGKSKVFNTRVKDKMGPNGEVVYVSKTGEYYWIDKKGRHHTVPAAALKNKS